MILYLVIDLEVNGLLGLDPDDQLVAVVALSGAELFLVYVSWDVPSRRKCGEWP